MPQLLGLMGQQIEAQLQASLPGPVYRAQAAFASRSAPTGSHLLQPDSSSRASACGWLTMSICPREQRASAALVGGVRQIRKPSQAVGLAAMLFSSRSPDVSGGLRSG